MDIWATREKSLFWLDNELKEERIIIETGLELLHTLIRKYEDICRNENNKENGEFATVCGLTIAKFNFLFLGCYSLALDGLAQESGAMGRLMVEIYELLVYFRLDRTRVEEALNGKLPSPGKIARKIQGEFQELRDYFNEHASHYGFTHEANKHLMRKDWQASCFPSHSLNGFRVNLGFLYAFEVFVIVEATSCLIVLGVDNNQMADKVMEWKKNGEVVFQQTNKL